MHVILCSFTSISLVLYMRKRNPFKVCLTLRKNLKKKSKFSNKCVSSLPSLQIILMLLYNSKIKWNEEFRIKIGLTTSQLKLLNKIIEYGAASSGVLKLKTVFSLAGLREKSTKVLSSNTIENLMFSAFPADSPLILREIVSSLINVACVFDWGTWKNCWIIDRK